MSRTIAVTGTASGIGRALAARLTDGGDTVIGVDLRHADIIADLGTPEGRQSAADALVDRSGGVLDGLVACAGINTPAPPTIAVNFFGVTALMEALQPALAAAPAPRVAVVGSIAGTYATDPAVVTACLAGDEPTALQAAKEAVDGGRAGTLYPSSKAALAQWVRRTCVTADWASAGIPVNVVAPGVVLTAMTESLVNDPEMLEVMNRAVPMPLNGHARPEVLAASLAWLISPENSHITGQVVYVDGGADATLRGPAVF